MRDKRIVYMTEDMEKANYNPFSNRCRFCQMLGDLPDKYWCVEHDTEMTEHGICDKFIFGEFKRIMIAEVSQ